MLISSQLSHVDTISECFYIQSPIKQTKLLTVWGKSGEFSMDDHCALYNDSEILSDVGLLEICGIIFFPYTFLQ